MLKLFAPLWSYLNGTNVGAISHIDDDAIPVRSRIDHGGFEELFTQVSWPFSGAVAVAADATEGEPNHDNSVTCNTDSSPDLDMSAH